MNKLTQSTILSLAAVCGLAFAQEATTAPEIEPQSNIASDWNLKLGLSYRKFKDPKFKAATAAPQSGVYLLNVDSNIHTLEEAASYIQNHPSEPGFAAIVTSTGGEAGGKGDYGFQESVGFMIGGSATIAEEESLRLSLVSNFQYFQNDSGRYAPYSGSSNVSVHAYMLGSMNPTPTPDYGGTDDLGIKIGTAKMTMDMDLYVLDLGVSLAYEFENTLSLSLAMGPTVSLADIDSSCRVLYGGGDVSKKRTDNDLEFEYGYYLSAGAAYWFSEKYGISAEMRYDKAFGDVGTRYVTQNLDAWGGNVAFLMRF